MFVCEAVKAIDKKDFDVAIKNIDAALELFPDNKETRFYRITIQISKFQECEDPELGKIIIRRLNEFIKDKQNEHMLYYFRGILRLYQQDFAKALKDFTQSIEYCDTVVAKYHLGRARCYACINMFKEALQDLNIALEANDTLIEAYILRGKYSFISGDTKQAFSDFQTIISLRPDDPMMHIHAGNILMTSGAYDQSIKAYTNAYKLKAIPMALFGRAKCYVAICSISKALADITLVARNEPEKFKIDLECLKILHKLCKDCIVKVAQGKGVDEKVWSQALVKLKNLIALLTSKAKKKNTQSPPKLMENIELDNTSIFSCEDLMLYKGVINFYLKKYQAALNVFRF
jgi:tetratricopeptide (TPR) repeat protein